MPTPCNNQEYKKTCLVTEGYLPCCNGKNDAHRYNNGGFFDGGSSGQGVLLEFFELKEVLLRKKMLKFRSKGISMHPSLYPGDILHLEYRKIDEINLGEIAVYRRGNNLFGHRVIDKGRQEGRAYLITHADNPGRSCGDRIFGDDIAGVVGEVERKGNIRGYIKQAILGRIKMFFSRAPLSQAVFLIQYFPLYKFISSPLFLRTKKALNFYLSIPLSGSIDCRFHKTVSLKDLSLIKSEETAFLKLTVSSGVWHNAAVSFSFVRYPNECCFSGWWVSSVKIMASYRGSIIEEEALKKSDEALIALGAQRVAASVSRGDYFSRLFFGGLGFKPRICDEARGDIVTLERTVKKNPNI